MLILGVETSCDETAASVVEDGRTVLSNVISSSKDDFSASGGVIPEYAARRQIECMLPVLTKALSDAQCDPEELDAIAVTHGPGLLGSLLTGTTTMRVLADLWKKPLIGVHHHQGHLDSIWLDLSENEVTFPVLTLSVSGGHTELWYRESHTKQTQLGTTLDDAAGEAFDKGALLLSLPYPGGPALAKLAEKGDEQAFKFPHPLAESDNIEFSFSGLKTSLKYLLRDLPDASEKHADIAASYQRAICLHLTERVELAVKKFPAIQEIHIVGGVSANQRLRTLLTDTFTLPIRWPKKIVYCTDNGAMIAAAGYFLWQEKKIHRHWKTEASIQLQN